jgi:hypothetical protein
MTDDAHDGRIPAAANRGPAVEDPADRAGREPGELVVGLSPRQIIGGFALLAGLIIWLRRRGRRKG